MRLFPTSVRGRLRLIGGLALLLAVMFIAADIAREHASAMSHGTLALLALLSIAVLLLAAALVTLDRTVRDALARLRVAATEAEGVRGVRIPEEGPEEFAALARALNRTFEARDRAEKDLFRTVERHDLIVRATRDMIWDRDLRTGRIHRNEALRNFSGAGEVANADPDRWFHRIPEPDRTRVRRSLEEAIERGESIWTQEYPLNGNAGGRSRIVDRRYVVRDDEGTPVRIVGVMSDVTEQRRKSDAVVRARDRYESILRHAPFGVFLAGPDGVIMEWNPALERMMGEEWQGTVPARKASQFFVDPEEFEHLSREARVAGTIIGREALWRRADGGEIFVRLTASAFLERGRIALEVLAEDVTERRRLGEQVRQAQKMEAVGRLAGGVAHDFNNLLTVISGEARFLLSGDVDQEFSEDVREALEAIREAGDRGGGLTRQLLAFSRRQIVARRPLDLNEVVEQVRRMMVRLIGERVELRTHLAPDLQRVVADAGEIEQAIVNLAVNARDAMPDGGVLEIVTSNVRISPDGRSKYPELGPGSYVSLAVRDEGVGMDSRTKGRIFEPFFTTKPVGKGTGLGLSTVYGIVTRSGGVLDVDTTPGMGTTMRILLPAFEGEHAGEEPPPPVVAIPADVPGEGSVMVVEDETRVRRMAERVLERAGYVVATHGTADEALAALEEEGSMPDLLITDVRMPGMNGEELAERVRMRCPSLPVLFVSGYPEEVAIQDRVRDRLSDFLAKPFTPRDLLARVQLLMAHRPAGR